MRERIILYTDDRQILVKSSNFHIGFRTDISCHHRISNIRYIHYAFRTHYLLPTYRTFTVVIVPICMAECLAILEGCGIFFSAERA